MAAAAAAGRGGNKSEMKILRLTYLNERAIKFDQAWLSSGKDGIIIVIIISTATNAASEAKAAEEEKSLTFIKFISYFYLIGSISRYLLKNMYFGKKNKETLNKK